MQTSEQGIVFIEQHEGVVLTAYRDPVGVWTIGAGLTSDSGVITPKAGMTISKKEARRLLGAALRQNYEPRVRAAMAGAKQHEFDAGVSFDFNTGAIKRASWLKAWAARDQDDTRRRLKMWNKAGGRVLAGLTRRRDEEADILLHGTYPRGVLPTRQPGEARIVVPLSRYDIIELRGEFAAAGYAMADRSWGFEEAVIRAFQRDHDLTVDGIVGNATISTLRRMRAAQAAAQAPAAALIGGLGATAVMPEGFVPASGNLLAALLAVAVVLWLAVRAWHYRDAIAARIQRRLPRVAAFLRSF